MWLASDSAPSLLLDVTDHSTRTTQLYVLAHRKGCNICVQCPPSVYLFPTVAASRQQKGASLMANCKFVNCFYSGRYAPIPSQYSDSMKALVETLIRKEPSDRPDLEVNPYAPWLASYGVLSASLPLNRHKTITCIGCTWMHTRWELWYKEFCIWDWGNMPYFWLWSLEKLEATCRLTVSCADLMQYLRFSALLPSAMSTTAFHSLWKCWRYIFCNVPWSLRWYLHSLSHCIIKGDRLDGWICRRCSSWRLWRKVSCYIRSTSRRVSWNASNPLRGRSIN